MKLGDILRNQETVSHGSIVSAEWKKQCYCNCYICSWKELFINKRYKLLCKDQDSCRFHACEQLIMVRTFISKV